MIPATDTIVAASSPPGRSARGLVRLSGPASGTVLAGLIYRSVPATNRPASPRQLMPCRLCLPARSREGGVLTQPPGLFWIAHQPDTYTGQDMAEIQCPGNPALLGRVIHRAIALGARLAEPGEFTFRAFLVGKLDLTQAEGVAATIAATSDSQLQAAVLLREGALGRFAAEGVDLLAGQLARVEAGIDFVDQDDVVSISPAELDDNLAQIGQRLKGLLSNSRSWAALEALPRVVLAGAPSTGKSTLFNALLGRPRAVTATTPGTTRDVLYEPLTLTAVDEQRIEVMLVDVAGLDIPSGVLDRQVQAAARGALAQADVVMHLRDNDDAPASFSGQRPHQPVIQVRTKADRGVLAPSRFDVSVSAYDGSGLDELRRLIVARVAHRGVSVAAQMLALQPRHESALRHAVDHLGTARELLADQRDRHQIEQVELVADNLRAALDELACLGGQMTPDDIIGRVFTTFCIGK